MPGNNDVEVTLRVRGEGLDTIKQAETGTDKLTQATKRETSAVDDLAKKVGELKRAQEAVKNVGTEAADSSTRAYQAAIRRAQQYERTAGKTGIEQREAQIQAELAKFAGRSAQDRERLNALLQAGLAAERAALAAAELKAAQDEKDAAIKQRNLDITRKLTQLEKEAATFGRTGVSALQARRALDLKTVGDSPAAIASVNAQYATMIARQKEMDAQNEKLKNSSKGLIGALGGIGNAIKGTALAIIGFKAISTILEAPAQIVGVAAEYQRYSMSLRAVSSSASEASEKLKVLQRVSQQPGLDLDTTVSGVVRLQAAGIGFDKSIAMVKAFGNALAIVGGTSDDLKGVIIALTQIAATPFVQGDEIRQLQERLPQIRFLMMEAFGESRTKELKKLGISSQEFLTRITQAAQGLGKAQNTISTAQTQFMDAMKRTLNDATKGVTEYYRAALEGVTAWLRANTAVREQIEEISADLEAKTNMPWFKRWFAAYQQATGNFSESPAQMRKDDLGGKRAAKSGLNAYAELLGITNPAEGAAQGAQFYAAAEKSLLEKVGAGDVRKNVNDLNAVREAYGKLTAQFKLGLFTEKEFAIITDRYHTKLKELDPTLAKIEKLENKHADALERGRKAMALTLDMQRKRIMKDIEEGREKLSPQGIKADLTAGLDDLFKMDDERRKLSDAYRTETAKLDRDEYEQRYQAAESALLRERDLKLAQLGAMRTVTTTDNIELERMKLAVDEDYARKSLAIAQRKADAEKRIALSNVINDAISGGISQEDALARYVLIERNAATQREQLTVESEASIAKSRIDTSAKINQMLLSEESKLRNSIRAGWEQTFDALTTNFRGWGNLWKQILNASLLTPIKKMASEIFTSFTMPIAQSLRSLFPASVASGAGGAGGWGRSVAGVAGLPAIGLSGIGGWGGGIGGWGGQAAGGTSTIATAAGIGGAASLGGLFGLGAGFASGGALGMFGAFKAGRSDKPWLKYSAPAIGAVSGLFAMSGLMAMFPALVATGPIGLIIGLIAAAGIGATIGLMGMWKKSAESKTIAKVKDLYGIKIDAQFAKTIVEMAKSQYGGNIDMTIRTSQVRDLILLYGMSTDQNKGYYDDRPRGVYLQQAGGSLTQVGSGGYGYSSSIIPSLGIRPYLPTAPSPTVNNITLNVEGAAVNDVLEGKTVTFIANNPVPVQRANQSALRSSHGRSDARVILLDPLSVGV